MIVIDVGLGSEKYVENGIAFDNFRRYSWHAYHNVNLYTHENYNSFHSRHRKNGAQR